MSLEDDECYTSLRLDPDSAPHRLCDRWLHHGNASLHYHLRQIIRDLSHVLVDQVIEPDQVMDETLSDLIEGVKAAIVVDGLYQ